MNNLDTNCLLDHCTKTIFDLSKVTQMFGHLFPQDNSNSGSHTTHSLGASRILEMVNLKKGKNNLSLDEYNPNHHPQSPNNHNPFVRSHNKPSLNITTQAPFNRNTITTNQFNPIRCQCQCQCQ